ncbi:MAG: FtsW/RodA/SpoVE family cell cycle protein [Lactobacillales bacterium]|jgi:rod shape determining protein RodA|nr:FtsW/RodA/SpoVE family cell cycle protein [Lactobacillales bacterium]
MKNFFARIKRVDSRIDYGIVLSVFCLSLIGLAALYVALSHSSVKINIPVAMTKQLMWYVIGVAACIVLMNLKPKWLWKLTPWAYGASLALMAALLVFYDKDLAKVTGSKNWFSFHGFSFQPSEIMKIAFILMLAKIIAEHNNIYKKKFAVNDVILIGKMIAVLAPVAILIALQDDFGTMLVFLAIMAGMFLVSGISWKIILPVLVLFGGLASSGLYMVTSDSGRKILHGIGFKEYQFKRVDGWIDALTGHLSGYSQIKQGIMAISNGGLFGKGFNHSDVYVPVRESDMIFTVIGENFGFVGSCVLIILYFYLIYSLVSTALNIGNPFYIFITTGITMMILFHVFENIGANIGLLPLTGIPLPFVSQGGSSLLANMMGIGLAMAMRFQFNPSQMDGIKIKERKS